MKKNIGLELIKSFLVTIKSIMKFSHTWSKLADYSEVFMVMHREHILPKMVDLLGSIWFNIGALSHIPLTS